MKVIFNTKDYRNVLIYEHWKKNKSWMPKSKLGEVFNLDKSAIGRIINKMEKLNKK